MEVDTGLFIGRVQHPFGFGPDVSGGLCRPEPPGIARHVEQGSDQGIAKGGMQRLRGPKVGLLFIGIKIKTADIQSERRAELIKSGQQLSNTRHVVRVVTPNNQLLFLGQFGDLAFVHFHGG